jgi:hypothetical protein
MSHPSRTPAVARCLALLQAARLHNGMACALLAIAGLWHGGRVPCPAGG